MLRHITTFSVPDLSSPELLWCPPNYVKISFQNPRPFSTVTISNRSKVSTLISPLSEVRAAEAFSPVNFNVRVLMLQRAEAQNSTSSFMRRKKLRVLPYEHAHLGPVPIVM
jgi:hypothetical protein